jgi:hypothetical protein
VFHNFNAAGAGTHNIDEVEVCEPGKAFRKDCNVCQCSESGITAFCTQKACGKALAFRRKRGKMYWLSLLMHKRRLS